MRNFTIRIQEDYLVLVKDLLKKEITEQVSKANSYDDLQLCGDLIECLNKMFNTTEQK